MSSKPQISGNRQTKSVWNKPVELKGKFYCVEMGDLTLTIQRLAYEWQLTYRWDKKGNDGLFHCDYVDELPSIEGTTDRIALQSMTSAVTLKPALADRPVVVRPYSPLIIPAHNLIKLYVSTPLWLTLEFAPGNTRELPVQQLSETWMGLPTGEGELCYGSHTHARLDANLLLKLPFRALTPVNILNTGEKPFTLERLSIPAPHLSLFEGDCQFVTEPMSIKMEPETNQGVVEIGSNDSKDRIAGPRIKEHTGILVKTWENLFA